MGLFRTLRSVASFARPTLSARKRRFDRAANIDDLRLEIDELDAAILAAVKRRTEVSRIIGKARMASGGTRLVHSREMKVIERYSELGPEGKDLAMLLLRLGRGRLGH